MEDVMDDNRNVFVWQPDMVPQEIVFGDDKCLCMWTYVECRRVHNNHMNRLVQPNVEKTVRAHDNLVLRKDIL